MSKLVPYLGGKRLLTKTIIALLPEHHLYCEAFGGSGTILLEKTPSPAEIFNDLNGDMINLFRAVQHHPEEFLRQVRWNLRSRQEFNRLCASPPQLLTDIQRAARIYYLLRTGYGGKLPTAGGRNFTGKSMGSQRPFSIYRIEETLYEIHRRLENVTIEHLPYEICITRYDAPDTLFYLDPPYFNHEKDYGSGIFAPADFQNLAILLKKLQGKFLLSLNDTPEVRLIFAGNHFMEVTTTYNIAPIPRRAKKARELLIANYDLKAACQKAS
jgi:DNA adenine methylase